MNFPDKINNFLKTDSIIFSYGSRVYGTFSETSDYDFIVIVPNGFPHNDQESFENINLNIYSEDEFEEQLKNHEVSIIEAIFTKPIWKSTSLRVPNFSLSLPKLRESISQKSSNSWVKAKKKITVGSVIPKEDDYYVGIKSFFHAFRILDYGIQIAVNGKIIDFSSSNSIWEEINNKKWAWDELDKEFRERFRNLQTEFRKVAPKEIL